jgi:uncharacterized delta-60 repeat protein
MAQVDTAWVRRYDGLCDSTDLARAIVIGPEGEVYVTGQSFDEDTLEDFVTVRYEPDGQVRWVHHCDGSYDSTSRAKALAVDSAGCCYATGVTLFPATRFDWMTVKHTTTGGTDWIAYFDGTQGDIDEPRAIAVVPGGGCVVAGVAFGPSGNWDYTTIRYGPDGETLWVRQLSGSAGLGDYAEALVLDSSGNVYVTGSSPGTGTNWDILTVKYSPAGEVLWTRRYTGTGGNTEDKATCIAVDHSQDVYVGGYTDGWGTSRDFVLVRYSADNGETLWTRRYNGPNDDYDEVVGVGVSAAGRVYVAGYSYGIGTFADYFVLCYSPAGDSLWALRWDYMGNDNYPTAMAVDGDGNSYVTGYGFDRATQYDFHTISLGPNGEPRWQIRYNGTADDWDQPTGIALDADRNVFVTGYSMSNTQDFDYATIKYVQEQGIQEAQNAEVRTPNFGPTIVHKVLMMMGRQPTANGSQLGTGLYDANGRKVMNLSPGENDISLLAPGVYFIRQGSAALARRIVVTE